jgi:hypothetical protein
MRRAALVETCFSSPIFAGGGRLGIPNDRQIANALSDVGKAVRRTSRKVSVIGKFAYLPRTPFSSMSGSFPINPTCRYRAHGIPRPL